MSVHVKWQDGFHLKGISPSGQTVNLDAAEKVGGRGAGFLPSELLLTALGGCTTMDILSLLAKFHASPAALEVELSGTNNSEHPKSFLAITAIYRLSGDVQPEQAFKAVKSSYDKYSVVANSLNADIDYKVFVNGEEIAGEK